jgi:RND family efflux transporter MFP subunit
MANEGQVISPGSPVFQTNGAAQSNWKLRASISDREWALVSVGDPAIVTTDAMPGKTFNAQVSRKSEGSEMMGGTFNIELTLKDKQLNLASGLYGKAEIETRKKQTAWSIPYEALLDGNAQSGYVFTLDDSNQVHKTTVQILRIDHHRVLISGGLENVKQIIISGSAYLKDGSSVEIRN